MAKNKLRRNKVVLKDRGLVYNRDEQRTNMEFALAQISKVGTANMDF